ncbi:transposase [Candidatus Acetothermia bacterium]|nr:transposase [Candidatus Acetothermia bacterium]MBI3644177.1 transposase [Candidatus Acetothermia bacterium]
MFRYFEKPELTPIIQSLIVQSSLPLKAVEIDFAADSSGFSTSKLINWNETKYKGHGDMEHDWLKAHLMTGVKTNTVTAVEVWDRHTHDSFLFKFLVEATAKNFDMREVSADKGYLSARNLEAVTKFGATPYIPFKSNTVLREVPNSLWDRMFHYFSFNRTDFMSHYHKRSNVESTFSMIKGKFGDYVRSKTPTAQMNEVLLKVLCHNICVLIQATHELGIETQFRN